MTSFGSTNAEQRRPDEDAGGDLGDDGRDVDAVRDLGGDLGRDEHDQDVEQDRVDVHRARTLGQEVRTFRAAPWGPGARPHHHRVVAGHWCAPGSSLHAREASR